MVSLDYRRMNEIISYYSLLLAICGPIGNLSVAAICLTKELRRTPTFVFLAFLSFTNAFSLYYWNFNEFFLTFYNLGVGDLNVYLCRLTNYFQMSLHQASSFLLVALSVERYLSIKILHWRTTAYSSKRAATTCLLLLLFFFALNFHLMFTLPFNPALDESSRGACYRSSLYKTWRKIHSYFYSFVLFILLFLVNVLLIFQIVYANKTSVIGNSLHSNRNRRISVTVLGFTLAFIIFTGPFSIMGGYYLSKMYSTEKDRAIFFSMACLAHTYHASDLLILIIINERFRKEFKKWITYIKKSLVEW